MGVAEYEAKLISSLPKQLKEQLSTIEEIEAELSFIKTLKAKKQKKKKQKI